jgi:hypothetical protein
MVKIYTLCSLYNSLFCIPYYIYCLYIYIIYKLRNYLTCPLAIIWYFIEYFQYFRFRFQYLNLELLNLGISLLFVIRHLLFLCVGEFLFSVYFLLVNRFYFHFVHIILVFRLKQTKSQKINHCR